MSTLIEKRRYLIEALQSSKEYRDQYVEANVRNGIAFQLRTMREERGWTQEQLGQNAGGIKQETISQYEGGGYGRFSLTTLLRLASAFDVDLVVRFGSFGDRISYMTRLQPTDLAIPSFDEEQLTETVDEYVSNSN